MTSRAAPIAALVVIGAGLTAATAAADPQALICSARGEPVPVALRDGGFDAGRGACLTDEVAVRIQALAAIDTGNFYGTLGGGFAVAFRRTVTDRVELGLTVNGYRATFAQDAVIKVTDGGAGPILVHVAIGQSVHGDGSPTGRSAAVLAVSIPYTDVGHAVHGVAAQLAALRSLTLSPRWAFHARAALLGWFAGSAGGTTHRFAWIMGGDAVVAATGRLSFALGADAQAGWRGGFDQFLVRPGMRIRVHGGTRIELGGGLRFGGEERIDAAVTLGVVIGD